MAPHIPSSDVHELESLHCPALEYDLPAVYVPGGRPDLDRLRGSTSEDGSQMRPSAFLALVFASLQPRWARVPQSRAAPGHLARSSGAAVSPDRGDHWSEASDLSRESRIIARRIPGPVRGRAAHDRSREAGRVLRGVRGALQPRLLERSDSERQLFPADGAGGRSRALAYAGVGNRDLAVDRAGLSATGAFLRATRGECDR